MQLKRKRPVSSPTMEEDDQIGGKRKTKHRRKPRKKTAGKRNIPEKGSKNIATLDITMVSDTTVGITIALLMTMCCVFCMMECECCGEYCAECGRGEQFDAHAVSDPSDVEIVVSPIAV